MNPSRVLLVCWIGFLLPASLCGDSALAGEFPPELVDFVPYEGNPVFAGTGEDTWDRKIRERGYIRREAGHRIPFIARWPGKIKAGSESDALISNS
jgi:hypothetical protein